MSKLNEKKGVKESKFSTLLKTKFECPIENIRGRLI